MLKRLLHSLSHSSRSLSRMSCTCWRWCRGLEPPALIARKQEQISAKEREDAGHAINKYQQVLSAYFPADHWSQQRTPKVIESGSVMLVVDDYVRHDDNRVDMSHFALVMFPTPRDKAPLRREMRSFSKRRRWLICNSTSIFTPERANWAKYCTACSLARSRSIANMKNPGPDDDLLVETSDVEMNPKLLVSPNEVRFRFGRERGQRPRAGNPPAQGRAIRIKIGRPEDCRHRNFGDSPRGEAASLHGRFEAAAGSKSENKDLEADNRRSVIRRLPLTSATPITAPGGWGRGPPSPQSSTSGGSPRLVPSPTQLISNVAGRDIRLTSAEEPVANEDKAAAPAKPPVDVTCSGPFHFDFQTYIASFDRDVEVVQLNPEGPSDQLSCQQLDIHSARNRPMEISRPRPIPPASNKRTWANLRHRPSLHKVIQWSSSRRHARKK